MAYTLQVTLSLTLKLARSVTTAMVATILCQNKPAHNMTYLFGYTSRTFPFSSRISIFHGKSNPILLKRRRIVPDLTENLGTHMRYEIVCNTLEVAKSLYHSN